eukprot:601522-Hanusia_phi.AAC.1
MTSQVQCSTNNVTLTFTPSVQLPKDSVLTVVGINSPIMGALSQITEASNLLEAQEIMEAKCQDWCSSFGLCPTDGNAAGIGCISWNSNASIGLLTNQRCARWCDEAAELKLM